MLINRIQFQNFNNIFFTSSRNVSSPIGHSLEKDVFVRQNPKTEALKENFEIPNYNDIKQFSAYLEKKIKTSLQDPTEEEIETLVSDISNETGAKKKEVLEVISRLTQFSNYSQLKEIEKLLKKENVEDIESTKCKRTFSLNSVLDYLYYSKKQIQLKESGCSAAFADDNLLCYSKANVLKESLDKGHAKLFLVDGWSAKVNGIDVSHSMFGSPLTLKDAAIRIIEEKQKTNKSLDDILNGDIIERTKKVLGDDVDINIIKNKKAKPTVQNIVERMKSNYPSKEAIQAVVEAIVEKNMTYSLPSEKKEAMAVLSKYFDNMISCFSQETLTKLLKDKYKEIKKNVEAHGRTMDDVIYLIPSSGKSFDLITYQYAKANKVPITQIKKLEEERICKADKQNKTFVILDDIVGSGLSLIEIEFNYEDFIKNIDKKSNIIFAPISSLEIGRERIENRCWDYGRQYKDLFLPSVIIDYNDFYNTLSEREQNLLTRLTGHAGYSKSHACTAMPYMTPDNNTNASGVLLNYMLNHTEGNKTRKWVNILKPYINKRVKELTNEN